MRKILAVLLAAILLTGFVPGAPALAQTGAAAPPCSIEVIKLRADGAGSPHYSMDDVAAADANQTIYYAIKLELSSVADVNAYYGNSGFFSGSGVEVTIKWNNVAGKGNQTVMVPLTSEKQTLWFDGSNFTPAWTPAASADCGCGESHILSAQLADATQKAEIQASVGTKGGNLADITIGGCYKIEEKQYYGVIPCVNCKPSNLSGYLFSGDCTAYGVFFSTNAANHVTGAYVVDSNMRSVMPAFAQTLYGWRVSGTYNANCLTGTCEVRPKFALAALPANTWLDESTGVTMLDRTDSENLAWIENGAGILSSSGSTDITNAFNTWKDDGQLPDNVVGVDGTSTEDMLFSVYTLAEDDSYIRVSGKHVTGKAWAHEIYTGRTSETATPEVNYGQYAYTGTLYKYGDTYVETNPTGDAGLFQQTSATTVNCDTNEAAYLNTLNHLYSLLGFTYADIAEGNVIMSVESLLALFGGSSVFEQHRDSKTWAYYVDPGDIKINPPQAQIKLGGKQKFTATASGEGNLKQGVAWSVEGSESPSKATKVSEDGELVVAVDEEADTLTLRAVDKSNPNRTGTVIVDVVSYNIKGQVNKDKTGKENVKVQLKQGDNVVAETMTDSSGNYAFGRLAEGIYNVVASEGEDEKEVIRTSLADIHDNDLTMDVIELPTLVTNSVVTVTGGSTPNVVVGGLDDIFEDSESGSEAYTASDAQTVHDGGSVKLTMQVVQEAKNENDENQKKIKEKKDAKEEIALYLDMSVSKEVKDNSGAPISSDGVVKDTGRLLTIVIPLPEDMHGKPSYVVYRVHDGVAEQLGHSTGDKEGFEIIASEDMATPIMKIYAQKFSVYALGYSDEAPLTPSTTGGGGMSAVSSTNVGVTGGTPVIRGSMQNTEIAVQQGQSTTLTVQADNASNYQWQVDRNDGRGWVNIDGANSASYTVSPTGADASGVRYRCMVSNGNGSVYSKVFTLHIVTAVAGVPATGPASACVLPCALLLFAALLYLCTKRSPLHRL